MPSEKPRNIVEKIWDEHVVVQKEGHPAVLGIDLQLVHEVTSPQAFATLREKDLPVRYPGKIAATLDHAVPTRIDRENIFDEVAKKQVQTLRQNVKDFGVPFFDFGSGNQGIVHVLGPDLGITQPGLTIICGDSHTSTHGAFGAFAFGVGTTEVSLMLATGCILQSPPKTMKVEFKGKLQKGVFSKDMILKLISMIGIGGGNGHMFVYIGSAVRSLSMEARMSICNMSIEGGARAGIVEPDQTTFDYLKTKKDTIKISGSDLEKIADEVKFPLKIHSQEGKGASFATLSLIVELSKRGRKFIFFSAKNQAKQDLLKKLPDEDVAWVRDLSRISANLDKKVIVVDGFDKETINTTLDWIEGERVVVVKNVEELNNSPLEGWQGDSPDGVDLKDNQLPPYPLPSPQPLAPGDPVVRGSLGPLPSRPNLILSGDFTDIDPLPWEPQSELQFSPYKDQLMPELSELEVLWTVCSPRDYRPKNEDWHNALEYWKSLPGDKDCRYDRELVIDVDNLEPMITWGTNPGEGIPITGTVPYLKDISEENRNNVVKSLEYTKLKEGQKLEGLPVSFVFMGSCTNSRIEDLRIVAKILQGKKVAEGVTMYVVPGSEAVRKQAEKEGLDKIFKDAGAEWRMPGCSMCLGMNDDKVPAGQRCIATSNRNFMNRQGPGAITHLASPATAAASAITGKITDPRSVL